MRLPATPAALIVTLGLFGGCGGGNGEDDATGSPAKAFSVQADTTLTTAKALTKKSVFVDRVNQICRKNWPVVLHNFAQFSSWQNRHLSEPQLFAKSVRLSYTAGVDFLIFDEIYNMGAPPGQEKAGEAVIGAMQEAVERGQRLQPIPSRPQLQALFAEYNSKARAYGFTDCLVEGSHLPQTSKPEGI